MVTLSRPLLVPTVASALLLAAAYGTAGAEVYLPRVVGRCSVQPCPRPTALLPADESSVLSDMALPEGARLVFFEVRPEAQPPDAIAEYSVPASDRGDLGRWYRERLSALGWRLTSVAPAGQRWERDGAWLSVELPGPGPDRRWLRLRREPGGASPATGRSLVIEAPLPAGGVRWRFDRADLFAEEVRFQERRAVVAEELAARLASAGWVAGGAAEVASGEVTRYRRGGDVLLASVRSLGPDRTEIALGVTDCLDRRTPDGPSESVYLRGVPAPPASALVGYEREADDGAIERWSSGCLDIDLLEAAAQVSWRDRDWSVPPASRRRSPGTLEVSVETVTGPILLLRARAMAAGVVDTELVRNPSERRMPEGRSLLATDLPVPAGADAERFERGVGDWAWRETYGLPASSADPIAWFAEAMPLFGWSFEKSTGTADDAMAVYYGGGEEILLRATSGPAWAAALSRRRVCTSDLPRAVDAEGSRARRLDEVPVFPGAIFEGFAEAGERYAVRCASLDQLAAWYRGAMERGAWALAMTVGPEDRFQRTMVFVRPNERQLPPDLRTAWAEVEITRVWPYQYLLVHRRDQAGVRPSPVGP